MLIVELSMIWILDCLSSVADVYCLSVSFSRMKVMTFNSISQLQVKLATEFKNVIQLEKCSISITLDFQCPCGLCASLNSMWPPWRLES